MLLAVISPSQALIVIADTGATQAAAPYLVDIKLPNQAAIAHMLSSQLSQLKHKKIVMADELFPSYSHFTEGLVQNHPLNNSHLKLLNLFVIGTDSQSIRWAKINVVFLKRIKAIGVITNVDSLQDLKTTEAQTGLSLLPAQLDGLESIVGTSHYPFLIYRGEVSQ